MSTTIEEGAPDTGDEAPLFLQIEASGVRRIAGTVTVEGEVASRPVLLINRMRRGVVSEQLSAPDGSYEFVRLPRGNYTVVALDTANEFNAVVADMVKPVLPEGGE